MRPLSFRRALLPLAASLLLAACHGKEDLSQPGGSTPQAALQGSIDLIKAADFNGFWKHALPPADYATLRTDWSRQQQNQPPVSAVDRIRFTEAMQQLTGPDAQNKLYAQLQPRLAAMDQQYRDQVPVLVSVGAALLKNGVTQSKTLTAEQKQQIDSVIDALTPWAQKSPWFDETKAKQAVGVAVATARTLNLKSPDELRAMNFDNAMAKYSAGFAGVRQLLAIYGLSLDDTLNSVKLTTSSSGAGHAVVKIDYTLLGKPLSTTSKLVQQNGRWYSEDLLDNVRASHLQLATPAGPPVGQSPVSASAPAPAASVKKD